MPPDAHKYLETSHNHDRLSYEYTSHLDDPRTGLHPHSSNHYRVYSMNRYPSLSETTYPADHDTLPPLNAKSHYSQEEHSSRSPLGQYRSTLREHHTLSSSNLQNISQDNRGYSSLPDRATGYASQPGTSRYASSRRVSNASDASEHSHPDSHLDDTHSDEATHKLLSFPSMEQTSSIPMSNNPSRPFQHGNDQHHDYEPTYHHDLQHGEHLYSQPHIHYSQSHHPPGHYHQHRHLNAATSNPATPTQSHSHTSFSPINRRNTPNVVLPSLPPTLPYPHPPRSRATSDPYSINEDSYIEPSSSSKFSSYHDFGTGSNLNTGVSTQKKMQYERLSAPPPRFDAPAPEDDNILSRAGSGRTEQERTVETTIAERPGTGPASTPATIPPMIAGTIKKKKKSKMHECEICHKKFPSLLAEAKKKAEDADNV
ncbi:hypothetical protein JR316_0009021 [Psilocybe cubensis]|uniref:Uncharacterized protein n=1 Tax=Psilocybe cubensis TaxID=181762 RepID=A0ACB8GU64_PSICU|nr:hypothetical protein JR316_0009021 [Psilocybe cubensis]KAH9478564.1 hypothetical protein JR316_0009021 [Psilocybe cubensis]